MIKYLNSSIGKKQLVAVSGLGMVLFLIAHLSGNFLMFKGADALNAYSKMLHDLGPLLWVARIGLIGMFFLHFTLILILVIQNRKARDVQYSMPIYPKKRSLYTQTMRFSGLLIFVYIAVHLIDYTFTASTPTNAIVNGQFLGLYGLVYNSFLNPLRVVFYVLAMLSIGFHLNHGIQSVSQTFGKTPSVTLKRVGICLGTLIALGFSSIPIYVLIIHYL